VDAQQALADLTEISSQIQAAVVFDGKGKVAGSTLADAARTEALAKSAAQLVAAAAELKAVQSPLTQLEVATAEGSVFVVRDEQATIAATTGSNATVGLVFYDLKSALRSLKPKPAARRPATRKTTAVAKKTAPKKAPARKRTPRKKPDAP
jgi:predicted regulator of Ras-like GTPase activity (Roadblock/LC7/MglB family)